MSDDEIRQQVNDDLESVPYISGVNNHMGSRFMEDEIKLSVVMGQLKKRGLFFVDSRTTQYSKGEEVAVRLGIEFATRKVFIDNGQTYEEALQNLVRMRKNRGPLVMIGHPYPSTIRAIKEAVPILRATGVLIVPVSELAQLAGTKRP